MEDLYTRAKEYIDHKYLDLADVPKFIDGFVKLYEANQHLQAKISELGASKSFDVSDIAGDGHPNCPVCGKCIVCGWCPCP